MKTGAMPDATVLDLRDGEFTFTDSDGKTRTGRRKLLPVATVREGELSYPTG